MINIRRIRDGLKWIRILKKLIRWSSKKKRDKNF
jgi:hypothetical protein